MRLASEAYRSDPTDVPGPFAPRPALRLLGRSRAAATDVGTTTLTVRYTASGNTLRIFDISSGVSDGREGGPGRAPFGTQVTIRLQFKPMRTMDGGARCARGLETLILPGIFRRPQARRKRPATPTDDASPAAKRRGDRPGPWSRAPGPQDESCGNDVPAGQVHGSRETRLSSAVRSRTSGVRFTDLIVAAGFQPFPFYRSRTGCSPPRRWGSGVGPHPRQ